MKDESFFVVQGWMINQLHLKGLERDIFAIIYGFSQDEETEFTGSLSYLCESTGATKPSVIKALKNLTDSGLIVKRQETINKVIFNRYSVTLPVVKKLYRGSKETLPNNINNSILPSSPSLRSEEDTHFPPEGEESAKSSTDIFSDIIDMEYVPEEIKMVSELMEAGGFKHRYPSDVQKPSKIYQKSISYIHDILSGNFLNWNLDPKWKSMYIDDDDMKQLSNRCRTFEDAVYVIKNALFCLDKAKEVGFYPRNKAVLPKTFSDFLFCEHWGTSWFLQFYCNDNQTLEEVEEAKWVDKIPSAFRKAMSREGLRWKAALPRIAHNVCLLDEWHARTKKVMNHYTDYSWLSYAEDFWTAYVGWLSDLIGDGLPSRGHFSPYGKTHQAWMNAMAVDHEIDWSYLKKVPGETEKGYNDAI